MVFVCIVVLVLLVAVAGARPARSTMGEFELRRRKDQGNAAAGEILRREALLADILSVQRVLEALLMTVFTAVSVVTFGWLLGIVVAVLVALEYGALARVPLWQRRVQTLYERYEQHLLRFVEKFSGAIRLLRSVVPDKPSRALDSREELQHLVAQSGHLLSSDEKKLFAHGLVFESRQVSQIMTPRSVIDSISKKELLGPLVLDDLHKTGHSRFPVTDGDVDHVVGMLYIQNLLALDKKRSLTAEKAMESKVFYIREDHTLAQALAAFLRTRHHLFVVVNSYRETVGLLSLEDVIEALLGRKIMDEFDTHADLRAVAERNPHDNNQPKKHENV